MRDSRLPVFELACDTMTQGNKENYSGGPNMQVLDKKRISVTSKRQLTIPQKFYTELGFGSEAICTLLDGALVIEPVSQTPSGEFDDLILADLIKEGYEGEALLAEFKARRANVRPAVERLIQQAEDAARGNGEYATYEEVFGKCPD